ncbi:TEF1 protein [Drechmeria coniospora]|uniref:Elongation factor 1 alpha-like protein n=1 Tax=Drechmeria coniospora TaxID=98403 RepID=A0A151GD38_DRECN|nr:TEF1 protein [Drechmeria coniospora]KYK55017.1 TEF1 protein [Drechmeria coniospora]
MPVTTYTEDDLVDYDEFDEEDEEDGMSPEDRVAMSNATAEVKKALGSDTIKVTNTQIQEALWHYYYDVDKSVAYLNRTFIAPPQKSTPKKTSEGKSDEFFFSDTLGLFVRSAWAGRGPAGHRSDRACEMRSRDSGASAVSLQAQFSDMPWMNVPHDRKANLIPPSRPRGGLLGGSEGAQKMSKLQALAASRKKKIEEKKGLGNASFPERSMKRLSLSEHAGKGFADPSPSPTKRQKNAETAALPSHKRDLAPDSASKAQSQQLGAAQVSATHPGAAAAFTDSPLSSTRATADVLVSKPAPSAFAQTLFGDASDARQTNRPEVFAMPYAMSSAFLVDAFSQPSPDDIVLAAQAQAGKKVAPAQKASAKKTPSKAASKEEEVSTDVSNLKINDAPPPKSKGLDVVKEFENSNSKKSVSFVVVGHVDAGKSTLMGRLLVELKLVEQRTVDKYRRQAEKSGKQSFALAWVMDQGSEERDRGVTIDIATNHFETPTTKFTILDAPGHRDFVPNMIAGASQADFAILVIDANTGAYERGLKGQTREHVLLLRSLGVQRLVVAVNKLDMVAWSQDRFQEISEQVTGFLTGLGFQDKFVTFVPISGLNGDNIASKIEDTAASWYKGSTLLEALEESAPATARAVEKPFRMAISEVFRSQLGTTTLAGRIDSGTVQIGDKILVQPSGESAYVKSIMVDTAAQDWAVAGQSVSVALTNIDPIHIRVGDIICETTNPILCGDTFTMKAMAFDHVMPMPVDLHRGRLHAPGQIQSIIATIDKVTGATIKRKPKVVQPGGVARLVIQLASKVPLEAGQRVVIRSGGETIAAGLLES